MDPRDQGRRSDDIIGEGFEFESRCRRGNNKVIALQNRNEKGTG